MTFTDYFEAVKYKRQLMKNGHHATIYGAYNWSTGTITYTVKED